MSLTGNLEDLSIGDILQILFLSRRSGVLTIEGKDVRGRLYFQDGMIISAESNIVSNSIADLLIGSGVVDKGERDNIIAIIQQSGNRGEMLERLKTAIGLPDDKLKTLIKEGLEKVVYSLFLEEGTFDFELKDAQSVFEEIEKTPLQIVFNTPGLNPQYVAMEGTRIMDESRHGIIREEREKEPEPVKKEGIYRQPTPIVSKPEQIDKRTPQPESGNVTDTGIEIGLKIDAQKGMTPGLHLLKSMVYELQNPHTNPEITLLILRFASELMNRAVLLMVKKDHLSGLGQFGVNIEGKDANRIIRSIEIPLSEPSIFKDALEKRIAFKSPMNDTKWNNYFIEKLGGVKPVEAFIAPIMVNQKVAAILYCDNLPDNKPIGDTESLEIFLFQAGMAMERALLERRLTDSSLKTNNVKDDI